MVLINIGFVTFFYSSHIHKYKLYKILLYVINIQFFLKFVYLVISVVIFLTAAFFFTYLTL